MGVRKRGRQSGKKDRRSAGKERDGMARWGEGGREAGWLGGRHDWRDIWWGSEGGRKGGRQRCRERDGEAVTEGWKEEGREERRDEDRVWKAGRKTERDGGR